MTDNTQFERWIDQVCDRFDQQCQSKDACEKLDAVDFLDSCTQQLDPTVAEISQQRREEILVELWRMQLEWSARLGADLSTASLKSRYPQHAALLEQIQRTQTGSADSGQSALRQGLRHLFRSPEQTAGSRLGPFELIEQLGAGGMGTVWRARQTEPVRREVALKLIRAGIGDRQLVSRFRAECQALAVMSHPNVSQMLDAGRTDDGLPYLVMELVDGLPITHKAAQAKLDVRQRIELFLPVCQAVQHAHQKGIIHRDLKPSNILVADEGGKLAPKVIDFGLVKATEAPGEDATVHTLGGHFVGTPDYMSPEQTRGGEIDLDTRTDIYSLGAVLYELLTGARPLGTKRLAELPIDAALSAIRDQDPQLPSQRVESLRQDEPSETAKLAALTQPRELTGDLDWIVMKALDKDRNRRYESAAGLAADLQRFLDGQTVEAAPPSQWYRLKKFVGRYRIQTAAAALVLLSLVAGIIGTSAGYLEANRQAVALATQLELTESAREAEQQQRQLAEKNLGLVRKTNTVLNSVFENMDPNVGFESVPQLREVLGENVERLVSDLRSETLFDPLAAAELKSNLGTTLSSLGRTDSAVPLLREAIEARTIALGSDAPETLDSRYALGSALRGQGKFSEAVEELRATYLARKEQLGATAADTLRAGQALGMSLHLAGEVQEAIAQLDEVVANTDKNDESLVRLYVTMMNNLAAACRDASDFPRARTILEEIEPLGRDLLGPFDPLALNASNNLGTLYDDLGELEKAVVQHEFALERRTELLGPSHPETLTSESNLGTTLLRMKNFERAIPILERALKKRELVLGPDHPDTAATRNNLMGAFAETKRFTEAIPIAEEVCESFERTLGRTHQSFFVARNNLAAVLRMSGELERSFEISLENYDEIKNAMEPDHFLRLSFQHTLGAAYLRKEMPEEAIPHLLDCFERREKLLKIDHPDTVSTLSLLAGAYCQAQRVEEGSQRMQQFLELQRPRMPANSLPLANMLQKVAGDLSKAPNYELAGQLLEEAVEIRKTLEPSAWTTFEAASQRGICYLRQLRLDEAEPLLTESWRGLQDTKSSIPASARQCLVITVNGLIELHETLGNSAESDSYRQLKSELENELADLENNR
ncbi:MAG: serine/threonine protein kinase [Pirellulaceae bacterium]|nr:serine/threonine protein kinase [Pirellulaceae bacterium]